MIIVAGKWAPVSLALVAVTLWLFQNVYAEVGTALPLNGGAYNVLLNTTNKFMAALAASLYVFRPDTTLTPRTLLSYTATAVVSASEAMEYANLMVPQINPIWATISKYTWIPTELIPSYSRPLCKFDPYGHWRICYRGVDHFCVAFADSVHIGSHGLHFVLHE